MDTSQEKTGLWKAGYGEIGATLKALEDAGVTLKDLETLRKDKRMASEVAKLFQDSELQKIKPSDKGVNIIIPKLPPQEQTAIDLTIAESERFYNEVYNIKLIIPDRLFLPIEPIRGIYSLPLIINGNSYLDDLNFASGPLSERYAIYSYYGNDLTAVVDKPIINWSHEQKIRPYVLDVTDDSVKNKSYLLWLRPDIEADDFCKKKTAVEILNSTINVETLVERLRHQLFFDWRISQSKGGFFNGQGEIIKISTTEGNEDSLLDQKTVTLSCSRYSDGHVPDVSWDSGYGGLVVDWTSTADANDDLHSRAVVSC